MTATLVPIANLKGPKGDQGIQGVQGLPGTNAVPADSAVAGYISTGGSSATQTAADARYKTAVLANTAGVVGDGTADDTAALNALLSSAATFGYQVKLQPNSVVRLASGTLSLPSKTQLDLNGATIKSALPGTSDRAVTVSGASNVIIENGVIDGDKSHFAAATEQRHNILIVNSQNVIVRRIRSIAAKGDGIYVGDNLTGPSSKVVIDTVICDGNHRQGMSVSHVDGMDVVNSWFINTSGTAPQSGVDIEPNDAGIVCQGIKFTNCFFLNNAAFGLEVSLKGSPTARQGGIDLIGCTFNGNASDGVNLRDANEVRILGGEIRLNGGRGIQITQGYATISKAIKVSAVEIALNALAGIGLTYGVDGLLLEGNTIRDNGQTTANTYNGIDLSPSVASTNIRIIGNMSGGAQQKYGLVTTANCSNVTIVGNQWSGNTTSALQLADAIASRVMLDGSGIYAAGQVQLRSTAGTTLVALWNTSDTNLPRTTLRNDGSLHFGDGTTLDTDLARTGPSVMSLGSDDVLKTGQSVTGSRPAAATVGKGAQFYDTTLNKPIWSDGTNWKDAAGTTV